MTAEGSWELAPAYDLVFAPGPGGEHTMTIAGEGRAPARSHLLKAAALAQITDRDAEETLDEVATAVARWRTHARGAGVGARSARAIDKAIKECLARL
jgi:serine/threonine-protein kinase HipA